MPAVKYNDTAVVDRPWDGPAAEAKLKTPISGKVGQAEYAWYDAAGGDPDGDGYPDFKKDWSLPHHEVDGDGNPGDANVNGVRAALSRLGQSSTNIPEADKAAVRAHLQKHLDKFNAGKKSSSAEELETLEYALTCETEGRIWAVRPELLASLSQLDGRRITEATLTVLAEEVIAARGQPRQPQGGIAVVPLKGVIMPRMGLLSLLFGGGGGLNSFRSDLQTAVADPSVDSIVLDVDSPGGIVDHIPEAAQEIRDARAQKPVVAVANPQIASAAYWLASQADEVVATPSGDVGSVGVYTLHKDLSEAHAMRGITPTLISAGKYKVEGNPYEPLGDTARGALQQEVNDYYDMFTADVAKGRGVSQDQVKGGYGEGRSLIAKRAVSAGLADRVDTLEHTISRLQSPAGRAAIERKRAELAERDESFLLPVNGSGEEDGGRRLKVARTPAEINGLLVLAPSPSPNSTKEGMPA